MPPDAPVSAGAEASSAAPTPKVSALTNPKNDPCIVVNHSDVVLNAGVIEGLNPAPLVDEKATVRYTVPRATGATGCTYKLFGGNAIVDVRVYTADAASHWFNLHAVANEKNHSMAPLNVGLKGFTDCGHAVVSVEGDRLLEVTYRGGPCGIAATYVGALANSAWLKM